MLRDVVVIGASAGGLKALRHLAAYLPADLPACVLVTTHMAPTVPRPLAEIVAKAGPLPAVAAADGMPMTPGRIFMAVPDRHLLVDAGDLLRLVRGPRENRARPAVDSLFRSAARWCGPRVIGVVLSGSLDDGAAGLAAVVECGGVALVQDPREAAFDGMPRAASAAVPAAEVLPVAQLARRITELAGRPVRPATTGPGEGLIWETDMIRDGSSKTAQAGGPVKLGCPECGGGMSEVVTGQALHFVCHVGHSYSPETFLAARDENIEAAAWTVVSAMQEKATVKEQLAERAAQSGDEQGRRRHVDDAFRISRAAFLVREHLLMDEPKTSE